MPGLHCKKEVSQRGFVVSIDDADSIGCTMCKASCYNQQCSACHVPLCSQCISRPHQCASRCRQMHRSAPSPAPALREPSICKAQGSAGDSEARELSSSSIIDIDEEARETSLSSLSSTGSKKSQRPWHMSDPSEALFTQYFQMKRNNKTDANCVSQ